MSSELMSPSSKKEPLLIDPPDQNNESNTRSSSLAHSVGPSTAHEVHQTHDDIHHDSMDSPSSPRAPYNTVANHSVSIHRNQPIPSKQTLSKKLFNLEHYFSIPLLFMLAFFVYYDRGGLASALDSAQEQLLNDDALLSGAVASCYLFGFCFSSPIFAILGNRYPPLKMSAIGMTVWCLGAFLTGWPGPAFISNFVWLAGSRLLTGIGEASFLAFAGTIIDIIAPNESRSLWLGTFYMGIPLGYAMGYAVGGTIADMSIYVTHNCDATWYQKQDVTDCNESWRVIFITETLFVLPLCLIIYCMKQPPNMLVIKQAKDELMRLGNEDISTEKVQQEVEIHDAPVCEKLKRLATNRTFVLSALGYALQTFVTGTFAVDAITYLQKVYGWSSGKAGTTFGIITFVSGVAGSVFGGLVLDKLKSKMPDDSPAYMYCRPALKFLVFLSFVSFPFAFVVVLWNTIPVFIVGVALTEFFIFASAGPVNNVILWCVLYEDRPLAAALNTLAIHALGDACAPIAVGAMINSAKAAGHDSNYAYNFAFGIAVFWLIFSGIAFVGGVYTINWLERWMISKGQTSKKSALLINDTTH